MEPALSTESPFPVPTGLPRRHPVVWLPLWRLEHRAADSSWHLFAGQRKQVNKQLSILLTERRQTSCLAAKTLF
jgi:hypothetical protein